MGRHESFRQPPSQIQPCDRRILRLPGQPFHNTGGIVCKLKIPRIPGVNVGIQMRVAGQIIPYVAEVFAVVYTQAVELGHIIREQRLSQRVARPQWWRTQKEIRHRRYGTTGHANRAAMIDNRRVFVEKPVWSTHQNLYGRQAGARKNQLAITNIKCASSALFQSRDGQLAAVHIQGLCSGKAPFQHTN